MENRPLRIEAPDDAMVEVLRRMTEAERLAITFRMWDFARDMIRANLRQEHPDWSDEEIKHAAARRLSHGTV